MNGNSKDIEKASGSVGLIFLADWLYTVPIKKDKLPF